MKRIGSLRRVMGWDLMITAAGIFALIYGAAAQPGFFSGFNLSQLIAGVSERALIVLPMMLLLIAREIDLSVASILALGSVVLGLLVAAGVSPALAIPVVVALGACLGAVNGALVVFLGLPSLVVTLGTMALFRGVGYILLGSGSVNQLPEGLTNFGVNSVPYTWLPLTIIPFLLLAPLFGVMLHLTPTGRRIYAIGGNPVTALYSGINVSGIRLWLFVASGAVSSLAGVVYTARLANARANNGVGMELDVITVAMLGGISVFGGKGGIVGVVMALVLVAVVRNQLGIAGVGGDAQGTVVGLLLIAALLIRNFSRALGGGRLRRLLKRTGETPAV
ncbi:rhamnose transport system permease protein [Devosia sp. UYZn731]|uniref:ABC transporter permease n=1 Tax=Devosia sp. UYZn731 TaxID=3156345 RepID=UPI00339A9C0D